MYLLLDVRNPFIPILVIAGAVSSGKVIPIIYFTHKEIFIEVCKYTYYTNSRYLCIYVHICTYLYFPQKAVMILDQVYLLTSIVFFIKDARQFHPDQKNKYYRKAFLPHFPIQLKRIKHVVFRTKKHITYDIIPVRNYL